MAQGIVLGQAEPVAPHGKHSSLSHCRFAALSCVRAPLLTPKGPGSFLPQIIFLLFMVMGIFSPCPHSKVIPGELLLLCF